MKGRCRYPDGVRDFGEEIPRSPIDLVIEFHGAKDALAAAKWLCEQLGVDPTTLGWRAGNGLDEGGLADLEARTGTGAATPSGTGPAGAAENPQPPQDNGHDPAAAAGSVNPKVGGGDDGAGGKLPPPPPGGDGAGGAEDEELPPRELPPPPTPPTPEPLGPSPAAFSHEWMALKFSAAHHLDWRYVALWGKWQQWDGTRWRNEDTLRAYELARRICRAASAGCDEEKLAREIARASAVAGVEHLARADRRHAMRFDQYDAEDWDLNQPPRKE
jgi:hypothetical protein